MIDLSSSEGGSSFGDDESKSGTARPHARNDEPIAQGAEIPATQYLTSDDAGIGGRLKDTPEDFVVDEIPLYEPSGQGSHIYLKVQKRDLSHERLIEYLGRCLNISRHDIGSAGMKDRRAITRQWISAPEKCQDRIQEIESDQVQVLDASKHTNALKTGHCRGNRFEIVVRGVAADGESVAAKIIEQLRSFGCPNYYGLQRFGIGGQTLNTGYKLVTGDKKQSSISKARRKFLVRLSLSALQSAVFNDVLAERIRAGTFGTTRVGDVMTFPGSRALFEVTDAAAEQRRLAAGETLLTGPMFGVKMRPSSGETAEAEKSALASRGLRLGQFAGWKSVAPGGRRPLAVRPDFHEVSQNGDALRVAMTLPTGAFATVVLSEIMKTDDL